MAQVSPVAPTLRCVARVINRFPQLLAFFVIGTFLDDCGCARFATAGLNVYL